MKDFENVKKIIFKKQLFVFILRRKTKNYNAGYFH